MVLLMGRRFTLFQFFFKRDTKKLMALKEFCLKAASSISTLPIATPKHNTFLSWNLTLLLISEILPSRLSVWWMTVGNLPALFKPGPRKRGICGMRTCDARKPSYFWASFFHELLVLVQFLQVFHALEISTATLCLLAMHSISENAHLHARTRHVRELDGSCETLVTLRVIILEANLQLNGLDELALLLLGAFQHKGQTLFEVFDVQLTHGSKCFALRTLI